MQENAQNVTKPWLSPQFKITLKTFWQSQPKSSTRRKMNIVTPTKKEKTLFALIVLRECAISAI